MASGRRREGDEPLLHNDFDNKKSMLGMHFPLHTFTTNVTKGEQKMAMKLVLGDE